MRKALLLLLVFFTPLIAFGQQDDVVVVLNEGIVFGNSPSQVMLICQGVVNNTSTGVVSLSGSDSQSHTLAMQTRMVPGVVYSASVSSANSGTANGSSFWVQSAALTAYAPPGYYVTMDGVAAYSKKIDFPNGNTPGYYGQSVSICIHPIEDLDLRAGMATSLSVGKVIWKLSLGSLSNGQSAGYLAFANLASTTSIAQMLTQSNLTCSATSYDVKFVYKNSQLAQILAPQVSVEIVADPNNASGSIIKCHPPGISGTGPDGLNTFTYTPFATYTIAPGTSDTAGGTITANYFDATATVVGTTATRTLTTSLKRSGSTPNFTYTASAWSTGSTSLINQSRVLTGTSDVTTLYDNNNAIALKQSRTLISTGDPVLVGQPSQESVGSINPITKSYIYQTDVTQYGYGLPTTVVTNANPQVSGSGAQANITYGTASGLASKTVTPFKSSNGQITTASTYASDALGMLSRPFSTNRTLAGTTISSVQYYYDPALISVISSSHPNLKVFTGTKTVSTSGTAALVTTSKMFSEDAGTFPGYLSDGFYLHLPYSVKNPDGTKTCYFYGRGTWTQGTSPAPGVFTLSANGGLDAGPCAIAVTLNGGGTQTAVNSVSLGSNVPGSLSIDSLPVKDGYSTAAVTVRDSLARVVFVGNFAYVGATWNLLSWTTYAYNLANQLTQTTRSNGLITTSTYSGEQLSTSTDEANVKTSYTYDAADRVASSSTMSGTKAGPKTSLVYDAANRVLNQTVSNPDTSDVLVTTHTYDDAGRLIAESAPGLCPTSYAYSGDGLTVTQTLPNQATIVRKTNLDGSLQSLTGAGTIEKDYDYGFSTDGAWNSVSIGAQNSPRWQKTYTNRIGQVTKITQPDPSALTVTAGVEQGAYVTITKTYDGQGRLYSIARDGASTLYYQYDDFSQVSQIGLDVDSTSGIQLAGTDRAIGYTTDIESLGGALWSVQKTQIYPQNGSGTGVLASTIQKRLSGFSTGLVAEEQDTDINNNITKTTIAVSGSKVTATTTAPSRLSPSTVVVDSSTLQETLTDFDGSIAVYTYDGLYRLSNFVDKRNNKTTPTYKTNSGLVQAITDAFGATSNFVYDSMGRQTSSTDALNETVYTDYNLLGQVVHQWGSGTYPVAYTYNAYGQQNTLTTYRSSSLTSWSGSTWPSPPVAGDVTTWSYYAGTGALASKTDAAGQTQSFTYNNLGQPLKATSARGVTKNFSYFSATGELKSESYTVPPTSGAAATTEIDYTYTRLGQLDTVVDDSGTRKFAYSNDRLTSETLSAFFNNRVYSPSYETSTNAGLSKNDSSSLNGRSNGFTIATSPTVTEFSANVAISNVGWLTSLSSQLGTAAAAVFNYTYDSTSGVPISYTSGNFKIASTLEAKRDLLQELTASWNGTAVTDFTYTNDAVGRRTCIQQAGSAFSAYGSAIYRINRFNSRGELEATGMYSTSNGATGSELPGRHYEFRYDDIGNRLTAGETGSTSTDDIYSANSLNQYTSKENNTIRVTGTLAATAKVAVASSDGQIIGTSVNNQSFGGDFVPPFVSGPSTGTLTVAGAQTVSGTAHLSTSTKTWTSGGATQPFTYDADGNLTCDNINNYLYDAENRLVKVTRTSTAVATGFSNQTVAFIYDYLGRRIQKTVTIGSNAPTSTKFIYDGWKLVEEIDGSSGALLKTYTWNGGLMQIQDIAQGKTLLPAADGNGNITALINASTGATEAVYEYNSFGEMIRCEGSYAKSNNFRFSSEYQDDETGLIYYGMRFYSPTLGRFINRDPIEEEGGINLYAFCGNDGVNSRDFLGMDKTFTVTSWTRLASAKENDGTATISVVMSDDGKLISWTTISATGLALLYTNDFDVTPGGLGSFTFVIKNPAYKSGPGYQGPVDIFSEVFHVMDVGQPSGGSTGGNGSNPTPNSNGGTNAPSGSSGQGLSGGPGPQSGGSVANATISNAGGAGSEVISLAANSVAGSAVLPTENITLHAYFYGNLGPAAIKAADAQIEYFKDRLKEATKFGHNFNLIVTRTTTNVTDYMDIWKAHHAEPGHNVLFSYLGIPGRKVFGQTYGNTSYVFPGRNVDTVAHELGHQGSYTASAFAAWPLKDGVFDYSSLTFDYTHSMKPDNIMYSAENFLEKHVDQDWVDAMERLVDK